MISRQKSRFYVAILRPQALLRHTNGAQERNQKLCLLYEIDGNVWLHRKSKVLETGLLKKLRIDASKNCGLELACLENPVWENETPKNVSNQVVIADTLWSMEQFSAEVWKSHKERLV